MRQSDPTQPVDSDLPATSSEPAAARPAAVPSELLEEWKLARAARAEARDSGMPHLNVLLLGEEDAVYGTLEAMLADVDRPIVLWTPGQALALPMMPRGGTVVLNEVGALGGPDQLALLEWLEQTGGRVQVISTSTTSLLPSLDEGGFIESLYYRLNTVCLRLGEES